MIDYRCCRLSSSLYCVDTLRLVMCRAALSCPAGRRPPCTVCSSCLPQWQQEGVAQAQCCSSHLVYLPQ